MVKFTCEFIRDRKTIMIRFRFRFIVDRIFKQLSTASSGILFVQQVFGAIQIAAGIFQLDVAVREFDARMINVPLLTLLIICTLLTYCYFASRITAKLNQNINIIYTSKWYLLPLEQQRYIVHMICFAQRNHILYGLNMLPCSLDSFVMVSNYIPVFSLYPKSQWQSFPLKCLQLFAIVSRSWRHQLRTIWWWNNFENWKCLTIFKLEPCDSIHCGRVGKFLLLKEDITVMSDNIYVVSNVVIFTIYSQEFFMYVAQMESLR